MFKKIFCHECGLNVCVNEWGYSWNNCSRKFEVVWEIYLIKCDFTAEIQPRKTDSGTEPVSVGAVWLKKTRKRYIYHTYYVSERSFYKIHESERLPLNYASRKKHIELCLIGRHLCHNTKGERSTTDWKPLDMSGNDVICTSDSRSITRQFWKDLTKKPLLY